MLHAPVMPSASDPPQVFYQRKLPHWQPEAKPVFLTWRLHGSLPASLLRQLLTITNNPGKQFAAADRSLDQAQFGPLWLKEPQIAGCVETALRKGADELKVFSLHAYVIMANHVHILIEPGASLARITKGIKGAAARDANRILRRVGQPFWQQESFDHWVRNPVQFERIRSYIENNPVKAGLVAKPEHWLWSSAHK